MKKRFWGYALLTGMACLSAAINISTVNAIVDRKIREHAEQAAQAVQTILRPRSAEKTVVFSPAQAAADAAICHNTATFIEHVRQLS